MPSFTSGTQFNTPFGVNEYLRSTQDIKTESYTVATSVIPSITFNGVAGQKILQRGVVMAKITDGTEAGKIGPYQADGTEEVQTLTKSGTVSGGTFTLSFGGVVTAALDFDSTAAEIAAALNGLSTVVAAGGVTATGGPINTTAVVVTFTGVGADHPMIVVDGALLTGSTPAIGVAETTKGVAGAVDGRGVAANIVGINDTFLPWQLIERDVEVAVVYEASVLGAKLLEMNASGAFVAASSQTLTDLKAAQPVTVR